MNKLSGPFRRFVNKVPKNIFVLIFFTLLAITLTYPAAFRVTTHVMGHWGDPWMLMWMFWQTGEAIFGSNPDLTLTFTNYIFYPEGLELFHSITYNTLLSIPLQSVFDLHVIYNLLWFSTYILSGFGAYLLTKYLTKNELSALLAGIIFAFAPVRSVHALGHLAVISTQWIPFCALYLMKMVNEKKTRHAIYAGIFFILAVMASMESIFFMGLFVGLLFLYVISPKMTINWKSSLNNGLFNLTSNLSLSKKIADIKKNVRLFLIFAAVSFVGVLPLMYHLILMALSDKGISPSLWEIIFYSPDIVSFFIPAPLHPIFGSWTLPILAGFPGNIVEESRFIGFTVLFLAIFAVFNRGKDKIINFWVISSIFFFIMSLGPILQFFGPVLFHEGGYTVPIPMPFSIIRLIPFFDTRAPGRMAIWLMLSLAVLAGYGLKFFLDRIKQNKKSPLKTDKILAFVFSVLIIFEFLAVPFPTTPVPDPPEFYQQLAKEEGDFALLEIPATVNQMAGMVTFYYQTIHKKRMVYGIYMRLPPDIWDFQQRTPLVYQLTYLSPVSEDILNQSVTEIGESVLNYYNIRYVVINTMFMTEEQLRFAKGLLDKSIESSPSTHQHLVVYRVDETAPPKAFMKLGNGWHGLEKWHNGLTRWMENNGTIVIHHSEGEDVEFGFRVASFYKPRTLQVYLNDRLVTNYEIPTQFTNISIKLHLDEGENIVRFYTPDGCQRPVDIPELNNKDQRCLSLAFQNIFITAKEYKKDKT